jgi:hypothetical protein
MNSLNSWKGNLPQVAIRCRRRSEAQNQVRAVYEWAKAKSMAKMLAVQRIFKSNATGPFSPFRT